MIAGIVSTVELGAIWDSTAARNRDRVAPTEARVSTETTGWLVDVAGVATDPTSGSQAPVPMGLPSCSTTVGCSFRYATTVGGTKAGSGISASGTMSLSWLVGEGRLRIDVEVTQVVAIGVTLKCENV